MRRVANGEPILPHLTAEWFNSTLDKPVPPPQGIGGKVEQRSQLPLGVFIPSTEHPIAERFSPVAIQARADSYGNFISHTHYVNKESLTPYNWVIPQGEMSAAAKAQPCVFSGPTFASVVIRSSSHRYVNLDEDNLTLVSDDYGKGLILTPGIVASEEPAIIFISLMGDPGPKSWLLFSLTEITGREGNQLGSGICRILTHQGDGLVDTECEEILAYNSQDMDLPANGVYQAKWWNGIPLIDVAPCEIDEDETFDCESSSDSSSEG